MAGSLFGIDLRKVRHDADGEKFVVVRRDADGHWLPDRHGELDGESAWNLLADLGVLDERIGPLLDVARARFHERQRLSPAPPHAPRSVPSRRV